MRGVNVPVPVSMPRTLAAVPVHQTFGTGTGTVQFVTVFLGICVATAPLYILESSLAPDLLFDIGFFA